MKLLLVDDDQAFRIYLRVRFSLEDWECLEAANLTEARKLLAEHTFDIILIDIYLVAESGLALVSEIRENPAHGKKALIVAISGGVAGERAKTEDFLEAFDIDHYLEKPFQATYLIDELKRLKSGPR